MLDRRKIVVLVAAVAASLLPLIGIFDAAGSGACALETRTASSPDGGTGETGWAAGGIAPGLFGS